MAEEITLADIDQRILDQVWDDLFEQGVDSSAVINDLLDVVYDDSETLEENTDPTATHLGDLFAELVLGKIDSVFGSEVRESVILEVVQKKDKRGRRICYDEQTGKRVKCPEQPKAKKEKKEKGPSKAEQNKAKKQKAKQEIDSAVGTVLAGGEVSEETLSKLRESGKLLTAADLKRVLKQMSAKVSGKKDQLVDRVFDTLQAKMNEPAQRELGEILADAKRPGLSVEDKAKLLDELVEVLDQKSGEPKAKQKSKRQKPSHSKPAQTSKPSESQLWNAMKSSMTELKKRDEIVIIPELVDKIQEQYPAKNKEEIRKLLQSWQESDYLEIQIANNPEVEDRAQEGIRTPGGLLYYIDFQPGRQTPHPADARKPEPNKAEPAKSEPEQSPQATKEQQQATIRDAYNKLKRFREYSSGLVEVPHLMREIQRNTPNASLEDLKSVLADMIKSREFDGHVLNEVRAKDDKDQALRGSDIWDHGDPESVVYYLRKRD